MSLELQESEFQNNNLYRDQYRRALKWLLCMAFSCVGLSAVLVYMNFEPQQINYYATTTAGVTIPLHTLSEPIVTDSYLLEWASIATRQALNLDFVHYQEQLTQSKSYFTPGGWDKFLMALNKSGLMQTVQGKKLMMNAVVSAAPVILNRDILHGRFTWCIQLPLLITFSSASEQSKISMLVTMNVQRVPVLTAPRGIQISDFMAVNS